MPLLPNFGRRPRTGKVRTGSVITNTRVTGWEHCQSKTPSDKNEVIERTAVEALNTAPQRNARIKMSKEAESKDSEDDDPESSVWKFRLYVAGQAPISLRAFQNLQKLCEAHLPGQYVIDVIDLLTHPHLAREDRIVAIPTMIKMAPSPSRKIIGDLSNTKDLLARLQLGAGTDAVEHDEKPPPRE